MKKDVWASSFWLCFSVYIAVEAFRLGVGTALKPGPGFFPFGAALAVAIIAGFRLLRIRGESPLTSISGTSGAGEWKKILGVVAGMFVYAYLLQPVGFVICTFLLVAFFLRVIARQSWFMTVSFAGTVTVTAHLLFDVLLKAPLPRGVLTL